MSTINHKIACLSDAAKTSPEYAGIVPLFVELFRYLEKDGRETGITFRVSLANLPERVQGGFPLLSAEDLIVDVPVCRGFLKGAIDVLKRMGSAGDEGLDAISAALDSGAIDLPAVFRSILERNRAVMNEASEGLDVPAPLLEYICEMPLKASLEQIACGVTVEEFEGWQESYCPVCGSRAGIAELSGEEGRRSLCCSACTFRWPFKRIQCPFCGNEDGEKLSYFTAGEGATRVDTCKACSRYIKTRDARKGNSDVPLDVEDLLTMHLDLLAAKNRVKSSMLLL
jgi:FdhE protein